MKINHLQSGALYLAIFLFSLILFSINDQYNLQLLDSIGFIVTSFWLLSLFILQLNGINKASSTLYFGFFIVLGLFHLGIPLSLFFNYEGDYFADYFNRWFYSIYTMESLYAVYIFLLAYLLSFFYKPTNNFNITKIRIFEIKACYLKTFLCLYIIIVTSWIFIVKFLYNIDNYAIYQNNSQVPILNFVFVYLNQIIGFLLVILCTSKVHAKIAILIFLIWSLIAFPLGLRGEVIFPLVIALPLLVINNIVKVTYTKAIVGIVTILTLSSLVFIYRGDSDSNKEIDVSPLATIAELGGSLRPVHEVIKWTDTQDMNYQYGATYYAPFERAFLKFFPIKERVPATEDMRLMNVAIAEKAGPYGFSIIAESKINFSWIGVFFVGLFSGITLRILDTKIRLESYSLLTLSIVFALFFHIRQSFVGSFGVLIVNLAFSLTVICLVNLRKKAF